MPSAGARPKGYTQGWNPSERSRELIDHVQAVIRDSSYAVSVRFIFYRLVGNYGYPKTERDYQNLGNLLVKARRAQLIPFHAIADSGTEQQGGVRGYSSRAKFLDTYRDLADFFTLHELTDQPYHIELWSEDVGSIPMLAGISDDYPVTVYSTGGFSSVTVTHEIAERVLRRDKPTAFLHVGDYDPSGESIFYSMAQDIGAFVIGKRGGEWYPETGETCLHPEGGGPDFKPVRVALTEEQATEWDLETAPPKASDSRSRNWVGETVQVQAMSEAQMEEVVTGALEAHLDMDALQAVRDRSAELRDEMRPLVQRAFDDIVEELGE